jgi:1-deoxy-D-xylulose-5-phosphate synthase
VSQLLDNINSPADVKKLSAAELKTLAQEIREFITAAVGKSGGHLASNLGVVELTLALHYVFDFAADKLLWDVGHQCYTHKIITGRRNLFENLRKPGGVSGFPCPAESKYDQFVVGHAGTSVATAIGMALGAERLKSSEKIVVLVGDASIVNGLSFEALNNLHLVKRQLLIVLNDNSMAIDVTQGALAKFFARARLSSTYEDLRRTADSILEHLPLVGKSVEEAVRKIKKAFRMTVAPSQLFESLDIPYFGPVDGHDIASLIELFRAIAKLPHPAILHVYTKKGKGFQPADDDPRKFHSTGPFSVNGDVVELDIAGRSYTDAFADCLLELAEKDPRIVAVTAAMPDGTGLSKFRSKFPQRCLDVGIAESAAVDIAAGLVKAGLRPIVCIYSTFLQRSFDQIFQEVSLQNLPVVFCIDRAGLVGADGPTHHGLMDIGFLRMLPNIVLAAPSDEVELRQALEFAVATNQPVAVRYPKDTVSRGMLAATSSRPFELGKSVPARQAAGSEVAIVAYGTVLKQAMLAAESLQMQAIPVDVINARFAKPIDPEITALPGRGKCIITVEDHCMACGFGSAVLEAVSQMPAAASAGRLNARPPVTILAVQDGLIEHGPRAGQLAKAKITAEHIVEVVRQILSKKNSHQQT